GGGAERGGGRPRGGAPGAPRRGRGGPAAGPPSAPGAHPSRRYGRPAMPHGLPDKRADPGPLPPSSDWLRPRQQEREEGQDFSQLPLVQFPRGREGLFRAQGMPGHRPRWRIPGGTRPPQEVRRPWVAAERVDTIGGGGGRGGGGGPPATPWRG